MNAIHLLLLACSSAFGTAPPVCAPAPIVTNVIEIPAGPHVFGVFVGRTPCQELAEQLKVPASPECNKIKCRLFLFQDPQSHAPTTYIWKGKTTWEGKWAIRKGTKTDPNATVYQLEPGDPQGFLSFVKADDNILLFLNPRGDLLVGNIEFSYTLNRLMDK